MKKQNLVSILISIVLFTLPNLVFAQETKTFGQRGNNGNNGYNGRSGRNGQNTDIFADNTTQTYNLSGKNGEDGTDGQYGSHASNCQQPQRPDYNLQGANGGDGGDGGDGGKGGNGGNVTIYYEKPSQLKKLIIDNSGGKGGREGRGAEGGDGCSTSEKYWQVKYCTWELWGRRRDIEDSQWQPSQNRKLTPCTGVKEVDARQYIPPFPRINPNVALRWKYLGVTKTESYRARQGEQGKSGNDGRRGQDGSYGKVTLIPRKDIPTEKVNYDDFLTNLIGKKIDLVRNIWVQKQGLVSLLNSASEVPNNYTYLHSTANLSYTVDWQAKKTPQQLEIENINLGGGITLNKLQPKITLNLRSIPGTIDYNVKTKGNLTTLSITGGFAPSRVKSFRLDDFNPEKFEEIILIDEGEVRELLVNTSITVTTYLKNSAGEYKFRDKVTFDIPPHKLPRGNMGVEGNKYTLIIGRNLFSWMKSDADIMYSININQTTKSGTIYEQSLNVKFVIP